MNRIQNLSADDIERRPRHCRGLLTLTARVRSVASTPRGHVSCVLDSPAGRLRAFSDAAAVHLPELRPQTQVQVVLLRLHRTEADSHWHWQLLCCRAMREQVVLADEAITAGGTQ